MPQSSPSYSPRPTRYRPCHVVLTIVLAASYRVVLILVVSYSLSYSLCPTFYSPRRRHPHCYLPYSRSAHRVMLIASCSSRQAHRVGLIASGSARHIHSVGLIASCHICQLSFVSHTQSNATRVKTALLHVMIVAMDVTLGACAENAKCGSSIYRCTLDIENRTGLSHYTWNPLRVCECDVSIYCDVLCLNSQHNHGAMTRIIRMLFALPRLRPEEKCPDTAAFRRKMP